MCFWQCWAITIYNMHIAWSPDKERLKMHGGMKRKRKRKDSRNGVSCKGQDWRFWAYHMNPVHKWYWHAMQHIKVQKWIIIHVLYANSTNLMECSTQNWQILVEVYLTSHDSKSHLNSGLQLHNCNSNSCFQNLKNLNSK